MGLLAWLTGDQLSRRDIDRLNRTHRQEVEAWGGAAGWREAYKDGRIPRCTRDPFRPFLPPKDAD